MRSGKSILALLLVVLGVVCRVTPHPWNFAPVGAIALFGGAVFPRRLAIFVPLATMFLGDLIIGVHALMPVLYATYAVIAILGWSLREHRAAPRIALGATAGATLFFITSNFAVWALLDTYPRTLDGLAACYVAAIPYFGRTLSSDLLFSALFFGVYALAERRIAQANT